MKHFDVAVIGSGVSSLTAAALLSKKGLRVLVLEQYMKPGGYLHCFNRFGHRFDTGAHYVGALDRGQPFRVLLEYLDAYDSTLFTPLDPQGFDVFHFPEFKVEMAKGYPQAIETIAKVFPHERAAIQTFFDLTQQVVKCFPTYEFTDETIDVSRVLQSVEESLATVVCRLTSNESLKAVLYAYCSLHGVMPEETSFGFHAIMVDSLVRGPYGFTKGGDGLAQKLVEAIRKNGGEVLLKKKVVRISTEGKLAKSVEISDGEKFSADWIVSGAHPKLTLEWIDRPEIFSPAFRSRVKNLKESVGIFGIYGMHSNSRDFHALKNYYYFSSVHSAEMFGSKNPQDKPNGIFLCPSDRFEHAPQKPFPLSIHSIGPFEWFSPYQESRFGKRDQAYLDLKQVYAQKTLERIEDFGIPMRERFKEYVTSSPLTNLHFNGAIEGASYGIYHSIQNIGPRAIGPRTHIGNLLLTGQSTLFPGILGAAISGLRTAGHIVGIKAILGELKQSLHQNHEQSHEQNIEKS